MWTDTPQHHYAACQNSLHPVTSTTNPGSFKRAERLKSEKKKKQVEQRTAFVTAPGGGGGVPA